MLKDTLYKEDLKVTFVMISLRNNYQLQYTFSKINLYTFGYF